MARDTAHLRKTGRLRTCVFEPRHDWMSSAHVVPSIRLRYDAQHDREYLEDSFGQAVRLFEYLSCPKKNQIFFKISSHVDRLSDSIFDNRPSCPSDKPNKIYFCTYVVAKGMSFLDVKCLEIDIDLGWILDKEKILIYGWWKFS